MAAAAALLRLLSLALTLLAVRRNPIHLNPRKELLLFNWIGRTPEQEFVGEWRATTNDASEVDLLRGVHGKSCYARGKFARLRSAITAILGALPLIAMGLGVYAFRMAASR